MNQCYQCTELGPSPDCHCQRRTLSDACDKLVERCRELTKQLRAAWMEALCLWFGHRWRCLGRWNSPNEPGFQVQSSISAWECSRCGKTEVQQWDW